MSSTSGRALRPESVITSTWNCRSNTSGFTTKASTEVLVVSVHATNVAVLLPGHTRSQSMVQNQTTNRVGPMCFRLFGRVHCEEEEVMLTMASPMRDRRKWVRR